MKKSVRLLITFGIIVVGLLIAAYPFISNYLYEHKQEEVISAYDEQIEGEKEDVLKKEWELAEEYNKELLNANIVLSDPFDPNAFRAKTSHSYESLLNQSQDGVMGYLEIPVIDLNLTIGHGTGERVLESGVGHLKNTSLPVGGESTHAVLSAHTGLPGKKLFTDLSQMEKGDVFYIHVLGKKLSYQVDQIKVVKPEDTKDLTIQNEKDLVTLVTCTPYGVNSHRLLVRGKRIANELADEKSSNIEKKTESQWMKQYWHGVLIGLLILIWILLIYRVYRIWRKVNGY